MRKFIFALCAMFAALGVSPAHAATQQWIVLGDSYSTYVDGGQARHLDWTLISNERDVVFRNLSAPGAEMGHSGYFNNQGVIDQIDRICGWGSANCHGVIIQAGINDYQFGSSWQAYVDSIQRVINWAAAHGKPVIILDLLYVGPENVPNVTGKTLGDYRTHRFFMGLNYGHVHFFGRPASFNGSNPPLWSNGHPNIAGHRELANWIEAQASAAGFF